MKLYDSSSAKMSLMELFSEESLKGSNINVVKNKGMVVAETVTIFYY